MNNKPQSTPAPVRPPIRSPVRPVVRPSVSEQALAEAVDAAELYGARVNIRFADGSIAAAIRNEFNGWPEFVTAVARGLRPRQESTERSQDKSVNRTWFAKRGMPRKVTQDGLGKRRILHSIPEGPGPGRT
jgi:hypothetical protein